jgi:DNA-directed RNA polymerase subunit M/transcription elongation factor TFIIS
MKFLQGTVIDQVRQQLEGHEEKFKLMLQDRFDELESATGGGNLVTGKFCSSSNVIYNMRQTRSADEGMSAYLCCLKCGSSWKL